MASGRSTSKPGVMVKTEPGYGDMYVLSHCSCAIISLSVECYF